MNTIVITNTCICNGEPVFGGFCGFRTPQLKAIWGSRLKIVGKILRVVCSRMGLFEGSSEKAMIPIPRPESFSCIPPGITAPAASLKSPYTNARSMGNKEEELEICVGSGATILV